MSHQSVLASPSHPENSNTPPGSLNLIIFTSVLEPLVHVKHANESCLWFAEMNDITIGFDFEVNTYETKDLILDSSCCV